MQNPSEGARVGAGGLDGEMKLVWRDASQASRSMQITRVFSKLLIMGHTWVCKVQSRAVTALMEHMDGSLRNLEDRFRGLDD